MVKRPQNSPVDAAEIEIPTTFKQAAGELEGDNREDKKVTEGSSRYDATLKAKLADAANFQDFESKLFLILIGFS